MPAPGLVFEDVNGAIAVLAATPYVPTPVAESEHAIRALRSQAPAPGAAALSQTQESLMRDALDLVADCVAFEACVAEVQRFYWDDRDACVQVAAVRWLLELLATVTPLPGGRTFWKDCILTYLHNKLSAFKDLEADALKVAANARGFDLVIIPSHIYKCWRLFDLGAASKRTREGSRAPSLTPSFLNFPPLPDTPLVLTHSVEAIPCGIEDCPGGSSLGSDTSLIPPPTRLSIRRPLQSIISIPLIADEIAAELISSAQHADPPRAAPLAPF